MHFLFFYYQAEALSKVLIEKIKEEEQLLIHYYQEYEKTFAELKKLVDLAIIDDQFTEKAIVSLAEGLNVKFKYETLEEFQEFMISDDVLEL
ncbi:hypothetical protein [Ureibacillus sp. FSL K6-0786]|uniref:hypothetical protein n=1 Tax=Ureibacillus sp. FSL K6-0786 TaxID=2954607 RepID=UPI0030D91F05